ncbi:phosphatidylcholine synthase [bacterium JGI 053]|nr:phosphatidylcholine synthase [bacterium JGI 053]
MTSSGAPASGRVFTRFRSDVRTRTLLAWGVHCYTALGLVLSAGMAVMVVRGDAASMRAAFILMLAATVIDASDGSLARVVDVRRVLPGFDGRRLDDIIDFHTYTSLPLLLVWRSGVLRPEQAPWLIVPLLASAYGFSQADAKTADGYFRGFPSYWNVVALYLYFIHPSATVALAVLLGLAVLTFVPAKYLYPSQPGAVNRWTAVLAALWSVLLGLVLLGAVHPMRTWLIASLFFPAWYMLASWAVTIRDWSRRGTAAGGAATGATTPAL